jgi:hypothetical protein
MATIPTGSGYASDDIRRTILEVKKQLHQPAGFNMLRQLVWIVPVLLLCGVGCHTCGDRKPLFPRLHEFFTGDDRELTSSRPMPPERYDDRLAYLPGSPQNCTSCAPSSGVVLNNSYGNMPMGVPMGTSYVVPGTGSGGMLGTPQLSAPVMPRGYGTSPENELPNPGGFSNVTPAEMGRSTAPKPPTTLIGK